eukprot:GHRR01032530.1.p1 GENE.GHRR01032530.1~~GHRR01032530.1.p1  ORF type:complete len:100 (-),score=12.39 GHRR01032530.1:292-591(-)
MAGTNVTLHLWCILATTLGRTTVPIVPAVRTSFALLSLLSAIGLLLFKHNRHGQAVSMHSKGFDYIEDCHLQAADAVFLLWPVGGRYGHRGISKSVLLL